MVLVLVFTACAGPNAPVETVETAESSATETARLAATASLDVTSPTPFAKFAEGDDIQLAVSVSGVTVGQDGYVLRYFLDGVFIGDRANSAPFTVSGATAGQRHLAVQLSQTAGQGPVAGVHVRISKGCSSASDCVDGLICSNESCVGGECRYGSVGADCCDNDLECGDGVCTGGGCVECDANADCDDGDPCSLDTCSAGVCSHVVVSECCDVDADCDDGRSCTVDTCVAGYCEHSGSDDVQCCDTHDDCRPDDEPCVNYVCYVKTVGVETPVGTCRFGPLGLDCFADDSDCDDGDPCSDDRCDRPGEDAGTCVFEVPDGSSCCRYHSDCDDAEPGTFDRCIANSCTNEADPGYCALPPAPAVVINEFQAAPVAGVTKGDWVELQNTTESTVVDLDLWALHIDGQIVTLKKEAMLGTAPNRHLLYPGQRFVVAAGSSADNGGFLAQLVAGFELSSPFDGGKKAVSLALYDRAGVEIDKVVFDESWPWLQGHSFERKHPHMDGLDVASWRAAGTHVKRSLNRRYGDPTLEQWGSPRVPNYSSRDGIPNVACDAALPAGADACAVGVCGWRSRCEVSRGEGCCESDADCEEGNPCTSNTCKDGSCVTPVTIPGCCLSLVDCDDGNPCNVDRCVAGACRHSPNIEPGCCAPGDAGCFVGRSCEDTLLSGQSNGDGVYWVDPDGQGGVDAMEVYCDMTHGGWTLLGSYASSVPLVQRWDGRVAQTQGDEGASSVPRIWEDGVFGHVPMAAFEVDKRALRTECTLDPAQGGSFEWTRSGLFSDWTDGEKGNYGDKDTWGVFRPETGRHGHYICGYNLNHPQFPGMGWCRGPGIGGSFANHIGSVSWQNGNLAIGCNGAGMNAGVGDARIQIWLGPSADHPRDCAGVLASDPGAPDGVYLIDPDGEGGEIPFEAWCDMSSDGGGWTLVANYVSNKRLWTFDTHRDQVQSWMDNGGDTLTPPKLWEKDVNGHVAYERFDAASSEVRLRCRKLSSQPWTSYQLSGVFKGWSGGDQGTYGDPDGWGHVANKGEGRSHYFLCGSQRTGVYRGIGYCKGPGAPRTGFGNHAVSFNFMVDSGYSGGLSIGCAGEGLDRGMDSAWEGQMWVRPASTTRVSCTDILRNGESTGDGVYTVDPDGPGGQAPFRVWCDMTTDGGGWTLLGSYQSDKELFAWDGRVPQVQNDDGGKTLTDPPELWQSGVWGHVGFSRFDPKGAEVKLQCRKSDKESWFSASHVGLLDSWKAGDKGAYGDPNGWGVIGTAAEKFGRSHHFICGYVKNLGVYAGIGFCKGPGGSGAWANHDVSMSFTFAESNYSGGVSMGCNGVGLDRGKNAQWQGRVWIRDAGMPKSCADILASGRSTGDGLYMVDPDGPGGAEGIKVYCDMTLEGGGWTLVGVVAGHDEHRWSHASGIWEDDVTLGEVGPWDYADHKSPAWSEVGGDEVRIDYKAQPILRTKPCLGGATLADHFASLSWDCGGSWALTGNACSHACDLAKTAAVASDLSLMGGANRSKLFFKAGEYDGAQDANKDRTYLSTDYRWNVDYPTGLGAFCSGGCSGKAGEADLSGWHDGVVPVQNGPFVIYVR